MDEHSGLFTCLATHRGVQSKFMVQLNVLVQVAYLPPPHINNTLATHVGNGGEFSLTCSVTVDFGVMVDLRWQTPNARARRQGRLDVTEMTSRNLSLGGTHLKVVEKTLHISSVTLDDQGLYECSLMDHSGNLQTKREFVHVLKKEEPHLALTVDAFRDNNVEETQGPVQWIVRIDSHPEPKVVWYGPNGRPIPDPSDPHRSSKDYTVTSRLDGSKGSADAYTMLKINRLRLENSGKYKVKVTNGDIVREETFSLIIRAKPKVQATISNSQALYPIGHEYTLKCSARGYPAPKINWMFKPCSTFVDCDSGLKQDVPTTYEEKFSPYGRDAVVKHIARKSGIFICQVSNALGYDYHTVPFFVTDVSNGFAVEGPREVLQGDHMKLKCSASSYNYTKGSIRWIKKSLHGDKELTASDGDSTHYRLTPTSTEFSFSQELQFLNVTLLDKGRYVCRVRAQRHGHQREQERRRQRAKAQPVTLQDQYYNDASVDDDDDDDRYRAERPFDLVVLPLEAPEFIASNLDGGQASVTEPEDGLRLVCRVSGRPQPDVTWTLDGRPVNTTVNTTRVRTSDDGQVLSISYFAPRDEGLYACAAANKVSTVRRVQSVLLQSTLEREALYANISLPVIVGVIASILLVFLLIVAAKCCYGRRRRNRWKDPPTPPTPRLTQFELPQDQEEMDEMDECRMTLTSTTRDGSISPYAHLHLNHANNANPHHGSTSLMGTLPHPGTPHCHCHAGSIYGCSTAGTPQATLSRGGGGFRPKCAMCDYGQQAHLPMQSAAYAAPPFPHLATLQRYNPYGHIQAQQMGMMDGLPTPPQASPESSQVAMSSLGRGGGEESPSEAGLSGES